MESMTLTLANAIANIIAKTKFAISHSNVLLSTFYWLVDTGHYITQYNIHLVIDTRPGGLRR